MNKKRYGQFYTTNYDYILEGFDKPSCKIVEPFAGKGDLLEWVGHKNWEAYDIDPKRSDILKRDTLINPPSYKDSFVITNPPYLARNKSSSKIIYDKYGMNDLYKCFIISLVESECLGGILIIPCGFFLSPRDKDVKCRNFFLSKYKICKVKYFEETVFDDTTTTVVAFSFIKSDLPLDTQSIIWEKKPTCETKIFELSRVNKWIIAGDIYNIPKNPTIKVSRFVKNKKNTNTTNLTIYALDSGTYNGRIRLEYKKNYIYEGIDTSRSKATICIKNIYLSEDEQMDIAKKFNIFLETKRKEYWSLFLPQYRESKEYARKRIPFDLVYLIVSNLISNQEKKLYESPT